MCEPSILAVVNRKIATEHGTERTRGKGNYYECEVICNSLTVPGVKLGLANVYHCVCVFASIVSLELATASRLT